MGGGGYACHERSSIHGKTGNKTNLYSCTAGALQGAESLQSNQLILHEYFLHCNNLLSGIMDKLFAVTYVFPYSTVCPHAQRMKTTAPANTFPALLITMPLS